MMTSFHIYHRHSFSQQFSTRYLFTIWCLLRSNISLIDRYVAPRLFAWKFDYSCRHTYYFIRIMRKLMMKTYRNILMWHVIRIWVVFECNWYRSVKTLCITQWTTIKEKIRWMRHLNALLNHQNACFHLC